MNGNLTASLTRPLREGSKRRRRRRATALDAARTSWTTVVLASAYAARTSSPARPPTAWSTPGQDDSPIVPAHHRQPTTTRASCARRPNADHDVADLLARLDVPVRLDDLVQPIPPVDERLERSGLEQFLEVPHHLLVIPRNAKQDLLPANDANQRRNEHQDQILVQRASIRRQVDSARLQQSPAAEERALADRIQDHVVALLILGEILGREVDNPVGAQALTSSRCSVPQTAVTWAPRLFNSCTAAEPMAPVA